MKLIIDEDVRGRFEEMNSHDIEGVLSKIENELDENVLEIIIKKKYTDNMSKEFKVDKPISIIGSGVDGLPNMLTADMLARFLGVSKSKVYDLMKINPSAGGIPCLKFGRNKRVLKTDLQDWIKRMSNTI